MKHKPEVIQKLLAKLMREKCYSFPKLRRKLEVKKGRGVYIIYSPKGRVAHVGSTPRGKGGVAQRLRDHLAGNSSFVQKVSNGDGSKLRKGYKFRCLVIRDGRHRALVEAAGIGQLCPEHIGHGLDNSSK
jgi:hypothetical protein